jgi:hypothetical protein
LHPEGFDDHLGVYRHNLYSGCNDETDNLLRLRDNICYYAQIIDTYAPCIVGSSKWNNDLNMDFHCATTNKKVWNRKILSISDETFILLCLINYGKRWFAEFVKAEKLLVSKLSARTSQAATSNLHQLFFMLYPSSNRKRTHGQRRTKKTFP